MPLTKRPYRRRSEASRLEKAKGGDHSSPYESGERERVKRTIMSTSLIWSKKKKEAEGL